jgi:hypothetical protein
MQTRAMNSARPEDFFFEVSHVLSKHVYSVIKLYTLVLSSDGMYAADSSKEEQEHIQRLKTSCYRVIGRKFKSMGVFSSKNKKECICKALSFAIQVTDQHNVGLKVFIDPSRMPRGVIEVSVLRAILNGLQKMKLSEARMPAFDDSE